LVVVPAVGLDDRPTRILDQILPAQPVAPRRVEGETSRIPPRDLVPRGARAEDVQTGADVVATGDVAVQSLEDAVISERGTAGRFRRRAPSLGAGIDGGVDGAHPAVARRLPSGRERIVADGGHHEQITRAGGRDVRDANALRAVARELLGLVVEEIP